MTFFVATVTVTAAVLPENESDDELSTGATVAISIVATLITTLVVTTVIVCIIATFCYKRSIKRSANKQRGAENAFTVIEEVRINNVVNVTVGANSGANAAAATNNVVAVIETAFGTNYIEALDGDTAYTLTS